jgi:hypothetical protein
MAPMSCLPLWLRAHRAVIARGILLGSSLAGGGCSVALGGLDEAQCKTDADCEARGGEFAGSVCLDGVCAAKEVDPKWGCIGHVEPLQSGKMDTLKTIFLDLLTNEPAKGITVKLCNKYDTPCNAPLGMPTPAADGSVTVTIPSDVEAYLDVTGPDYIPSLAFLDHTVETENPIVYLIPSGVAGALAQNAGVVLDDTKAILLLRTADCTGKATAGASVAIFPTDKETRFYTIQNAVTADATKTDTAGNAGFVNVSPGTVTVTGTIGPGGPVYGSVQTLARAGTVTDQILRPTPSL